VLVALANGSLNPLAEDGFSIFAAIVLDERLRVHLIAQHIVGIAFDQCVKVRFGRDQIAFFDAFECDAVSAEGVLWILREEFLEFLTTGFVWFRHSDARIIRAG